MMFSFEFAFWW